MIPQLAEHIAITQSQGTTAEFGGWPHSIGKRVQVGRGLTVSYTTSTASETSADLYPLAADWTSSGSPLDSPPTKTALTSVPASEALSELRRLSGLTWEQLSELFDVSRRSLHHWASGKTISPANERKLHQLLATVRYIDRGSAGDNRAALLSAGEGGVIPFDLLQEGEYEQVRGLLERGSGRPTVTLTPLSNEALEDRTPPPP